MRSASTGVATRGSIAEVTMRGTCPGITTAWGPTATEVTMRSASTSVTTARGSTAEVTVLSASAGVAARRFNTGATTRMPAFTDVITRYRMRVRAPTTRRAAAGSTMASTVEATMIFWPTSARASVMRYIVRGASTRTTSTSGNNSPSRELARSRSRGHSGPAVIERRMQLFVSESRVLVITL